MEVFNVQIFGSDIDKLKSMSRQEQEKWIERHTNQKDKKQIKAFIDGNLRKAVSKEDTKSDRLIASEKTSSTGDKKKRTDTKKSQD